MERVANTPRAIGYIIAVVAVLLTQREIKAVVRVKAKRILAFLRPIDFRERMEKASFWSRA